MHTVLLGILPQLLNLWLSKDNKAKPFFIGDKLPLLNKCVQSIRIMDCISRLHRKLDKREDWKANKYRAWLLHYSIPVLEEVLPSLYLEHFILLAWFIYVLFTDNIPSGDLRKAELVLDDFCKPMGQL
ncbi:unnamed protein product [Porites lobata]|uniref:Uncharacterized protein n=1 Tax=Porites lobata TaxID=104759 RepID=A0ABN8R255_9CNID|nr:unnamed protein product [Porites lobata]